MILRGILCALLALFLSTDATAETDPYTSGPLFDELAEMDRIVFQNAFVECDAEKFRALFTEDAEFYHDKVGPMFGEKARTLNGCPANDGVRRVLVEDSLRVYPMAGYGAIQTGEHWFVEEGASTSTLAKFVTLWKRVDGEWKMARVLSFDHVSHPKREP